MLTKFKKIQKRNSVTGNQTGPAGWEPAILTIDHNGVLILSIVDSWFKPKRFWGKKLKMWVYNVCMPSLAQLAKMDNIRNQSSGREFWSRENGKDDVLISDSIELKKQSAVVSKQKEGNRSSSSTRKKGKTSIMVKPLIDTSFIESGEKLEVLIKKVKEAPVNRYSSSEKESDDNCKKKNTGWRISCVFLSFLGFGDASVLNV